MLTKIFANRTAFFARTNQDENGVDQAFADANPGWDEERYNEGCWNCSGCSGCSDCSRCSDCSDCSRCSDCSDCWNCSGCSDCWNCYAQKNAAPAPVAVQARVIVPVIPNIHQRVLEAVTGSPDALNMDTWHTCETTHCRAGWVVTLAGKKGKALEDFHNTELAAALIYHASAPTLPVSMPRFYDSNEAAMADMQRMAALEAAQG